jgi:hypothetical protein
MGDDKLFTCENAFSSLRIIGTINNISGNSFSQPATSLQTQNTVSYIYDVPTFCPHSHLATTMKFKFFLDKRGEL